MGKRCKISKSTPSIPAAESERFEFKAKLNSTKSKGASRKLFSSHCGACKGSVGTHGGLSLSRAF